MADNACDTYARSYASLKAQGYDRLDITTPARMTFEAVKSQLLRCGTPAGSKNGVAPGAPRNPIQNTSIADNFSVPAATADITTTSSLKVVAIAVALYFLYLEMKGR